MTDQQHLSLVRGDLGTPLLETTIGDALWRAAHDFAEREAVVIPHQGVRWTYADLAERSQWLAVALLDKGLRPGDRIGIYSPNRAEWVLMQFATALAGLVLVNVNPAYRSHELRYALGKVDCRALVAAPRFKTSDYTEIISAVRDDLPNLQHVWFLEDGGADGFDALAGRAPSPAECSRLAEVGQGLTSGDPINIQFTSGTTGSPKGATLTHRNILNNGYFVGAALGLSAVDRLCIPVPLYHCFGMVMGNLACLSHGATMVFPGEAFDAAGTLATIAAERCTGVYGVPTMFIAMLQAPEFGTTDTTSLRTGIMAGSPCPTEVMRRVIDDMGCDEVTICFGMTETSPVSFQTRRDDALERRVASVGTVHPHVEAKVVDLEGRVVPRGQSGEILVRGYSVMAGYWDDAERTAEAVDADGWMRTGDLGVIDGDGYCRIVGRAKDMIIRGGENISPREIEEFLYTHPAVADVQVFGVPDERYGEEVCVWVLPRPGEDLTEDAIRAFCKGRIAHYKVPRYVRVVDEFPMTVTGKIQKFRMRDQMAAELGQASAGSGTGPAV